MISKDHQKRNSKAFVDFLVDKGYYGDLTIKFENGNIVHMKLNKGLKIENINPNQLYSLFIGDQQKKKERTGFTIKEIIDKGVPENEKIG